MNFRTDINKNPTAFSVDVAHQAGLVLVKDYVNGSAFPDDPGMFTAHLLGDPIQITIRVIDALGFVTFRNAPGTARWNYVILPMFIWRELSPPQKRDVIGFMYRHEGGTAMVSLFPNYHLN
jgi:hypothetical protein